MRQLILRIFILFHMLFILAFVWGSTIDQFEKESFAGVVWVDDGLNDDLPKDSLDDDGIYLQNEIPQGNFIYELYFAEFGGRMSNAECNVKINGNKIVVTQNENTNLSGGDIIFEGLILKHKSGKWILTNKEEDTHADEIGGCTGIPIIDFNTQIIEMC